MKVRCDFVTNSSSSSYVIMYKTMPEIEKDVIDKYPTIENMLKVFNKVINGWETIKTIEDLDKYYIEQYGLRGSTLEEVFEDDDHAKNKYNEHKEKVEQGYSITFKSIDYGNEGLEEILKSLNDGDNFIVENEH